MPNESNTGRPCEVDSAGNVVPFPTPHAPRATPHAPTNIIHMIGYIGVQPNWSEFVERASGECCRELTATLNKLSHAVEVHRQNFPGEDFPEKALEEIGRLCLRMATLFDRAKGAVELEPKRT